MSSNHKATLNVQNYCEYVNNFLINDTINPSFIRYFLQQMVEKHVFPSTCETRNNDEIVKKLSYTALIIGKPV